MGLASCTMFSLCQLLTPGSVRAAAASRPALPCSQAPCPTAQARRRRRGRQRARPLCGGRARAYFWGWSCSWRAGGSSSPRRLSRRPMPSPSYSCGGRSSTWGGEGGRGGHTRAGWVGQGLGGRRFGAASQCCSAVGRPQQTSASTGPLCTGPTPCPPDRKDPAHLGRRHMVHGRLRWRGRERGAGGPPRQHGISAAHGRGIERNERGLGTKGRCESAAGRAHPYGGARVVNRAVRESRGRSFRQPSHACGLACLRSCSCSCISFSLSIAPLVDGLVGARNKSSGSLFGLVRVDIALLQNSSKSGLHAGQHTYKPQGNGVQTAVQRGVTWCSIPFHISTGADETNI